MSIGPNQLVQFSYILSRVQEKNFYDTRTDLPDVCGTFTKEGDTSRGADYRSATTVGLGQWGFTAEFGQFHKDAYEPGQERVSTWVKYTNGVVVSQELLLYMARNKRVYEDKVKMFTDINKQFKDTWQWTKEAICTLFQTNGTSTTATNSWPGAGRDLLALFSASHTSIKSPVVTIANIQGVQPFSQMACQEAETMLENMVDDAGRPQGPVTDVLYIIGRWWKWRAKEIFGTEGQVDTANNNVNALTADAKGATNVPKVRRRWIVNPYLSNTDTSWMVLDMSHHGLTQFVALEPLFEKERDISTGAMIFKCTTLFGIDFLTFRGAVRCAGA